MGKVRPKAQKPNCLTSRWLATRSPDVFLNPSHETLHITTNKKAGSQPTHFMAFQPSDPARASAVPRWTWARPLTNDMNVGEVQEKC